MATSKEPTEEQPRTGRLSRRPSRLLTRSRTTSTRKSVSPVQSFKYTASETGTPPPEPSKYDHLLKEAKTTSDEHSLLWEEHRRQIDTLIDNLIEIARYSNRNKPETTDKLKELARKQHATLQLHDETGHVQYTRFLQAATAYYEFREAFYLGTPEQEKYSNRKAGYEEKLN